MRRINTIIIGGGQAGLAMSRCLRDRAVDHVILERGRIAERWRSERWPSLRLLTPSFQARLPGGYHYSGPEPDGYMAVGELIAYLEAYGRSFSAPIEADTSVTRVVQDDALFRVSTTRGEYQSDNVVIATGHCDVPHVPALASRLSPDVLQLTPNRYRSAAQLPPGGVLIVGASATGVQLAEELRLAGHPVTLAVGTHTRLPRRYRGRDILWWLEHMGVLEQRAEQMRDLEAARRAPSMQLVGRPDNMPLDLGRLRALGVQLVGRMVDIREERLHFADDLSRTIASAEAKLERVCTRVDQYVKSHGLEREVEAAVRPAPIVAPGAPTELDVRAQRIASVVWATGFRRTYPWLRVPVLDARGEIVHQGGITQVPGLYVLGLAFLRRRKSSFLDGVGLDASELADSLVERARGRRSAA